MASAGELQLNHPKRPDLGNPLLTGFCNCSSREATPSFNTELRSSGGSWEECSALVAPGCLAPDMQERLT